EKLWTEVEADFHRRRQRASILRSTLINSVECDPLSGEITRQPLDVLTVDPVWESHTLAIADAIRKGQHELLVAPSPPLASTIIQPVKDDYIHRIMDLRER